MLRRVEGRLNRSSLRYALTNVSYTGDYLSNKHVKIIDRNGKTKTVKNNGHVGQMLLEGHHEAIVSRELFDAVQKLGNLGIRLLFEAERIDTIDARSELLATILSMFPQHASSSSYGSLYGFQSGGPLSSYQGAALRLRPILQPLYGFRKNPVSCNYEIEPYEADVVRLIFNLYEHGLSVAQISDELLRRDILPPHFNRIGTSAMKDTF